MKTIKKFKSDMELNRKWGDKQVVISKSQVKQLLKVFEQAEKQGIIKGEDWENLIFSNSVFSVFRVPGIQNEYYHISSL